MMKKILIAYMEHKLCKVPRYDYYRFRTKMLLESLTNNINNDETVVEMGCGWGFNLWSLLAANFQNLLEGYELSKNGLDAANQINKKYNCDVKLGKIDITDFETFPNLVNKTVFTFHVLEQLKYDTTKVIENIIKAKPKQVMHFEPVIELYGEKLRDKVLKSYLSGMDYQNNLLTTLKKFEKDGVIQILESERLGFASNPLNETSFIKWKIKN